MAEKEIGEVSTFFSKPSVAAIKLSGDLKIGDKIHVKGHTTDFELDIESMQIDNENVEKASSGDHIGIKVPDKVRPNDKVYLVE